MEKPGYCPRKEVTYIDEHLFYWTARFVDKINGKTADMGCANAKSAYVKKYYSFYIDMEQVEFDFNFGTGTRKKYDTIYCFEVIEHLQNSLHFMRTVKRMLKPGGTIYLSTPSRPKFLWTKHHFIEMNKQHLTKWILNPLGLKITKSRRIRIGQPWYFYFTGIRPFLRLFFNFTRIYEIIQN